VFWHRNVILTGGNLVLLLVLFLTLQGARRRK
jgi:hypothetical protein